LIYIINYEKISWILGKKSKEILLDNIRHLEVKKSPLDILELNTGSVFFYDLNRKKYPQCLAHIENIDAVMDLLNSLVTQ
jgi:hypothetical protein